MINGKALPLDLVREAGLPTERFPESIEEAELAEQTLAMELKKLSLDDHEKQLFEVHGLSNSDDATSQDDPQMIEKALVQLQYEINKIDKKKAYEQAKFLNASYVNDPKFRLMFLKCHEFDARTAAQTIVYHFEIKLQLFGDGDVLAREVLQSDLSPMDIKVLQSGALQVLPKRDASGRIVLVMSADYDPQRTMFDTDSFHRAYWYGGMAILRDEKVQKSGYVGVIVSAGTYKFDFQSFSKLITIEAAMPLPVASLHYCLRGTLNRVLVAGLTLFAPKHERFKTRIHSGTHEENKFKLQTFGIPVDEDDFPTQHDGSISAASIQWHQEWLQALQAQEEAEFHGSNNGNNNKNISTIIIPQKLDVLFGKKARAKEHFGNMSAHALVEKHFEAYEQANKMQKAIFAHWIVTVIQKSGGRFLRQEKDGTWVVVTDTIARQKVAHWCRHMRQQSFKEQDNNNISLKRATPSPPVQEKKNAATTSDDAKSATKRRTGTED